MASTATPGDSPPAGETIGLAGVADGRSGHRLGRRRRIGPEQKRLRALIEHPLRYPELFESAGLSTNLGVLLFGPPGTGKTLLAKAIASYTAVNFIPVWHTCVTVIDLALGPVGA